MKRKLPSDLAVEQVPPNFWRIWRVVGPLLGGFTTVFYKAEGKTREEAIEHYWRGGYDTDWFESDYPRSGCNER